MLGMLGEQGYIIVRPNKMHIFEIESEMVKYTLQFSLFRSDHKKCKQLEKKEKKKKKSKQRLVDPKSLCHF